MSFLTVHSADETIISHIEDFLAGIFDILRRLHTKSFD